MQKEIIHFSHGNGFPAETYRKFFSFLEDKFEINYINMHGHNPDYPIEHNWSELVEELIHTVSSKYSEPIFGVGHSLGGILTFLAAIKKPELFKAIVLMDALIPSHFRSKLFQTAKKLGWFDRFTAATRVRKRRIHWPDFVTALAYFQEKPLFKQFDPECLQDYVRYGTQETADGIVLRFDRNIESRIFQTIPHDIPRYRGQLKVPATLIYSQHHSIVNRFDRAYMRKYFHIRDVPMVGTHLFPFEYPEQTALLVKKILVNYGAITHLSKVKDE